MAQSNLHGVVFNVALALLTANVVAVDCSGVIPVSQREASCEDTSMFLQVATTPGRANKASGGEAATATESKAGIFGCNQQRQLDYVLWYECFAVAVAGFLVGLMSCLLWKSKGDAAEKRRSLWYGLGAAFILAISFLGFLPGSVVASVTGHWYADGFSKVNRPSVTEAQERLGNTWLGVLMLHIAVALGWNLLAPIQCLSAALGHPDGLARWWHKRAGYGVAYLGILGIGLGAGLELQKRLDGPRGEGYLPFISVLESGVMVVVNLVLGLYYVCGQDKDIQKHKIAMTWGASWSADAGGLRICSYFMSTFLMRDVFDDLVIAGATVIFTTLRLAMILPFAATLGDVQLDLLLTNVLLLGFRLVSAVCCAVGVTLGNAAAAAIFPFLALGLVAGIRSCMAGQSDAPESVEPSRPGLISNPAMLSAFKGCVHRPACSLVALAVLILASCTLWVPYTGLKNAPLDLDLFNTRLKNVQFAPQSEFSQNARNLTKIALLIWGDNGVVGNHAMLQDLEAAVLGLKESKISCSTLAWEGSLVAPARDAMAIALKLEVQPSTVIVPNECFANLRKVLDSFDDKLTGFNVKMASANAVIDSSLVSCNEEAGWHFVLGAPLMMILLMLGVGTVPRALTPFICLFASLAGVRAVMVFIKWAWWEFNLSNPDTALVFILMTLCFNYSVFFWSRFKQERGAHPQQDTYLEYLDAVMTALRTSGFVILLSMCVLLVTFCIGSIYPDHNKTGYLGTSLQLIVGVLLVSFYSLAIPASLAANFPSLFDEPCEGESCSFLETRVLIPTNSYLMARPAWTKWAGRYVTVKPWSVVVLLAVVICVIPLLVTLSSVTLSYDIYDNFASKSAPEFKANKVMAERFSLNGHDSALVLLEATPLNKMGRSPPYGTGASNVSLSPGFGKEVCKFVQSILDVTYGKAYQINSKDVAGIWWDSGRCSDVPLPTRANYLSLDGNRQFLRLSLNISAAGTVAQSMTDEFWTRLEPLAKEHTFQYDHNEYHLQAWLDTPLAEEMLMERKCRQFLPWVLLATLLAVCSIVSYCFASAFVACKMLATVLVPILAEYGLLVGIYQHGWLEQLGVERTNGINWMLLYNTVGLLLALAIDYDLFLFARVYERRAEGYDNRSAVRIALEETDLTITLVGSMMVLAFLSIFLSSVPMMAQLGGLCCLGVTINTYIVRIWLTPAVLCIHEEVNYWPGHMPSATKSYEDYVGACRSADSVLFVAHKWRLTCNDA